jgi:hypothetical protein
MTAHGLAARHPAANTLERFQDDFVQAIYGDCAPDSTVAMLAMQPGFAVYRNTIIKGCIDALQANYPTVERLVGTEWFRAAAAIYVREARPTDASMMEYGASFAEFLAQFEPAKALPYLADVARLDRFWIKSHTALDEEPIDPAILGRLPPEELAQAVLHPLASARWIWFAAQPIYTIWSVNREGKTLADDIEWVGQGALLLRHDGVVSWRSLEQGACAFLDACATGLPLERAANAAVEAQPSVDIAHMLSDLLAAGVFASVGHAPDFKNRRTT